MRKLALAFLFAFGLAGAPALAATELPARPLAEVSDFAGALRTGEVEKLSERFRKFNEATGHQAAVAIVRSLGEYDFGDVDTFANKLYERWRLGSKEKNDGILLVISMEDRKLRIEAGYGVEGILTDSVASRMIRDDITPFLKQGQLASAILVFNDQLFRIFHSKKAGEPVVEKKEKPEFIPSWIIFIGIFLFLLFIRRMNRFGGSRSRRTIGAGGIFLGGGGGFGGFGGGGGGFGGGGGLSGGGGSSGSW